jgi:hypothetical protein
MPRCRINNSRGLFNGLGSVRCPAATVSLITLAPHGAARAQVPQGIGFWNAQGRAVSGTRCGDWFVRLAIEDGTLVGVLGVGQGNIVIQNLVLRPDGSFSGTTPAGSVNSRSVRAYDISGRFTSDIASITVKNEICPDRTTAARRQPVGY